MSVSYTPVQCPDCKETYTPSSRYPDCRHCNCPECGEPVGLKGYCAPCSRSAARFEEMAYGRDD